MAWSWKNVLLAAEDKGKYNGLKHQYFIDCCSDCEIKKARRNSITGIVGQIRLRIHVDCYNVAYL